AGGAGPIGVSGRARLSAVGGDTDTGWAVGARTASGSWASFGAGELCRSDDGDLGAGTAAGLVAPPWKTMSKGIGTVGCGKRRAWCAPTAIRLSSATCNTTDARVARPVQVVSQAESRGQACADTMPGGRREEDKLCMGGRRSAHYGQEEESLLNL